MFEDITKGTGPMAKRGQIVRMSMNINALRAMVFADCM